MGVFDPGIAALSIATRIRPAPSFPEEATLPLPADRDAPIAAMLVLRDAVGVAVTVDYDWRQTGDIVVATDGGTPTLSRGGAVFAVPGERRQDPDRKDPGLYARFVELVRAGGSEVDVAPFRIAADAFLRGQRRTVEPFEDRRPLLTRLSPVTRRVSPPRRGACRPMPDRSARASPRALLRDRWRRWRLGRGHDPRSDRAAGRARAA